MNKKKKLTVLLVLLLVAVMSFAGYVTYARYISRGAGEQSVDVAKWAFTLDGEAATSDSTVVLTPGVVWAANNNVVAGKIAPAMNGAAEMKIVPTGTEVAFNFYVKAEFTGSFNNDNITVGTIDAQTCSDGSVATTAECTEGKTLTPITLVDGTGEYEGYMKGTVDLVGGAAMSVNESIFLTLPVEWVDEHPDVAADQADTATGIADPTDGNVRFEVIVEQKVN